MAPMASSCPTALFALVATLSACSPGSTVDCDAIPDSVGPLQAVPHARGHNGLAFDALGHMVGSDGTSLIRATADGSAELWVPDVGAGEQLAFLPDGDLVFVNSSGVVLRISPDGAITRLAEVNAYGMSIGPDGFVYTANLEVVHRIDPATGDRSAVLRDIELPKVVSWSPDRTLMYVGTALTEHGDIWEIDVDPDTLEVLGSPRLLANTGPWGWQDALGVDACGNIYVPEFHEATLWRFTPDGVGTRLLQLTEQTYTHGLAWGSGVGGWSDRSLFLPHPNDGHRVSELPIGVPRATW